MGQTVSSDASVIVPRIKHDKIQEFPHLEGSPNSKAIVEISLPVTYMSVMVNVYTLRAISYRIGIHSKYARTAFTLRVSTLTFGPSLRKDCSVLLRLVKPSR